MGNLRGVRGRARPLENGHPACRRKPPGSSPGLHRIRRFVLGGYVEGTGGAAADGLRPAALRVDPRWSERTTSVRCRVGRLGTGSLALHYILEPTGPVSP